MTNCQWSKESFLFMLMRYDSENKKNPNQPSGMLQLLQVMSHVMSLLVALLLCLFYNKKHCSHTGINKP